MSCGEPHETDCSEVLDHLYEFLDSEMPDVDRVKFKQHFNTSPRRMRALWSARRIA